MTGSGRAGDGVDSMLIVLDVVARDAVLVQRLQHDVVTSSYDTIKAGLKGGQTGQLPRASTTRGASTKNSKKIITRGNIKILFETDNLESKNMMPHYSFNSLNVYFYTFLKFRCRSL